MDEPACTSKFSTLIGVLPYSERGERWNQTDFCDREFGSQYFFCDRELLTVGHLVVPACLVVISSDDMGHREPNEAHLEHTG